MINMLGITNRRISRIRTFRKIRLEFRVAKVSVIYWLIDNC